MRKVCKVKLVKIITYFFWRWIRHNYFTSLSISLNRKLRIISIQIPILYEHLLSFTKSLRALWIYASLRKEELVRKEEALYLRFFTHELKIRKLWISCCVWLEEKAIPRWVHRKFFRPWSGPWRIVKVMSDATYRIQCEEIAPLRARRKTRLIVHFPRLKPYRTRLVLLQPSLHDVEEDSCSEVPTHHGPGPHGECYSY